MTEDEYLNHKEVIWMRGGLAERLASRPLEHRYYHFDTADYWCCTSVRDAAEKYSFRMKDRQVQALWEAQHPVTPSNGILFQTTAILNCLQCRLRKAVDGSDEDATLHICDLVLRWGGVSNRNRAKLHNLHSSDTGWSATSDVQETSFPQTRITQPMRLG